MKVGLDQIGRPTPVFYKKFLNALIIIIMPALAAYTAALPNNIITADNKVFLGATATLVIAILKAVGFIIGDDSDDSGTSNNKD